MIKPGQEIGGYLLEKQLGRGGMGAVFLGRSPEGAPVAVKTLLLREDRARQRFHRELKLGRAIDHPNVVKVRDGGEQDGDCWLVMEYVEGRTLTDVVKERGRLPGPMLARILKQLVDGLEVMHQRGLVHRDLKPDNLMITPDGVVKIMDLGLVHDPDVTALTRTGSVVGTPWFLAPEQLRDAKAVTPQADLFSAAVILFWTMTGKHPFGADKNPDMARYFGVLLEGRARAWHRSRTGGPLDRFFKQALHADPKRRFADARAMLLAYQGAIEGEREDGTEVDATLEIPDLGSDEDDATDVLAVNEPTPGSGPHLAQDTAAPSESISDSEAMPRSPLRPPPGRSGRLRSGLFALGGVGLILAGVLWRAARPDPALITEVQGLDRPGGKLLWIRADRPVRIRVEGGELLARQEEGRLSIFGFERVPEVVSALDEYDRPLYGKLSADIVWVEPRVLRRSYDRRGDVTLVLTEPAIGRLVLRGPEGEEIAGAGGEFRLERPEGSGRRPLRLLLEVGGVPLEWGEIPGAAGAREALERVLQLLEGVDPLPILSSVGKGRVAAAKLTRYFEASELPGSVAEVEALLLAALDGDRRFLGQAPRARETLSRILLLDAALVRAGVESPFEGLARGAGRHLWSHDFFADRKKARPHRKTFEVHRDAWALAAYDFSSGEQRTMGEFLEKLPVQELPGPDGDDPVWLELFTHRWGQGTFAAVEVNGRGPFYICEDPRADLEALFRAGPLPPGKERDPQRRVHRLLLPAGTVGRENRLRFRFYLWPHVEGQLPPAVILQAFGFTR